MRLIPAKKCQACKQPGLENAIYCHHCGKPLTRAAWPFIAVIAVGLILVLGIWRPWSIPKEQPQHLSTTEIPAHAARPIPSAKPKTGPMAEVEALMAKTHTDGSHIREAIKILDAQLEKHPDYAYGLRLRASLYGILNDFPGTVSAYKKYLSLVPEDTHARLAMANALIKIEQPQQALEECEQIYRQYPKFAKLLRTMQQACEAMEESAMAKKYQVELLQAMNLDPAKNQPPRVFHPQDPAAK